MMWSMQKGDFFVGTKVGYRSRTRDSGAATRLFFALRLWQIIGFEQFGDVTLYFLVHLLIGGFRQILFSIQFRMI